MLPDYEQPEVRTQCVELAARIAHRLQRDAHWRSGCCTWVVGGIPSTGSPSIVGGNVYRGAAGIALFLIEAARETNNVQLLRTAVGALKYALLTVDREGPAGGGYYTGSMGIAHAILRYRDVTHDDSLAYALPGLVKRAERMASADAPLDLISGIAGAIVGLLILDRAIEGLGAGDLAISLGDRLVDAAVLDNGELSWPPTEAQADRVTSNLCGLGHGAAGIAHALIELFRHSGEQRFLRAAEAGIRYENTWFIEEQGNWPDFRRRVARDSESTTTVAPSVEGALQKRPMCAWCHGALGIGYMRAHAWAVLGIDQYRRDAEIAIHTAVRSLSRGVPYCLCHGKSGVHDFLVFSRSRLGPLDLRENASMELLQDGERYEREGQVWPTNPEEGVGHPSLMVGDAGIGYTCLRIASNEVPCILLPTLT